MHIPVLLQEVIENLNIEPGQGTYIDGTLGGGGHSLEICRRLDPRGRLIAIDQDEKALSAACDKLSQYKEQITFVHNNFSNIREILAELDIREVQGFLLDLGVSSFQLDEGERGFSYMQDAPLDMRMNRQSGLTAREVVNTYSQEALHTLIKNYGEERWAKRIAEFIAEQRRTSPINTTFELVSVIKKAIPKGAREDGPHPAKRTFQAIRIEVNKELEILEKTIEDMTDFLAVGGRFCVITFHSLEDRIVKNTFRRLENPCTCPADFPLCVCGKKPLLKAVTRKPLVPQPEEMDANHRARSAKLRVVERI